MSDERRPQRPAVLLVGVAIASLVFGLVLAQFLPGFFASDHDAHSMAGEENASGLWTCGMHPHVLEEEPGQCPICGMNLVPLTSPGESLRDEDPMPEGEWTCTEHPRIVEPEPGTCPIDGLPLVLVETDPGADDQVVLFYRNPMNPTVTSPVPAKDSMGMDYVPVYANQAGAGGATVRIDPAVVQTMNVRTATADRRDLVRPIRTVGYLDFDQQRMVTVTPKYSGWIEKVYVNYVGEQVRKGQPLFEVYSPELVQTEQELLSAIQFAGEMDSAPDDARQRALSLVESARQRLRYWDVSEEQLQELEERGEVFRTLTVTAPSNGMVMMRMAGLEGMAVQPGMELFHIADLRSLWVSVELFEEQLAAVSPGSEAKIELSYFPGETFKGRVRFIEPALSEATRTARARIEVPNRTGRLRKGMYATVDLRPIAVEGAIAIPNQAVLRTGQRNVVIVALPEGRFRPMNVTVGIEADGYIQVLEGLEAGTEVVTSAQFLLDSESSLQEAVQKMVAERRDADGAK